MVLKLVSFRLLIVFILCISYGFAQQPDTTSVEYKMKLNALKTWKTQEAADRGYQRATLDKLKEFQSYFSAIPYSEAYLTTLLETALYYEREQTIKEALPHYETALAAFRKSSITDSWLVNKLFNRYAGALNEAGENLQAIALTKELLEFNKEYFYEEVGKTYYNLAASYSKTSNRELSLIYNDSAYQHCKESGIEDNTPLAAYIQFNKALNYRATGAYQESREAIDRADRIYTLIDKHSQPASRIMFLMYKSYVLNGPGTPEACKASIEQIDQALAILDPINPLYYNAYYLHTLYSENLYFLENYTKALEENRKAIKVLLHNFGTSNQDISLSYMHHARTFNRLSQIDSAEVYFEKSLSFFPENKDEENKYRFSEVALEAALFYAQQGNTQKAIELTLASLNSLAVGIKLNNVLEPLDFSKIPAHPELASRLFLQSKILENLYKHKNDLAYLDRASQAMLDCLRAVNQSKEALFNLKSKSRFYELKGSYFDNAIRVSHELYTKTESKTHLNRALLIMELNRNATLRSLISDSKQYNENLIPLKIRSEELELQAEINLLEERLQQSYDTLSSPSSRERARLKKTMLARKEDMVQLLLDIKKDYPEYYEVQYKNADWVSSIQKQINSWMNESSRALTLQFFESPEFWYLIARKKNDYKFIKLNRTNSLNRALDRFINSISSPGEADFSNEGLEIYNQLLVPLGSDFLSSHNYIIISDGKLSYLPFESLLFEKPKKTGSWGDYPYLIKNHRISYVNSILKSTGQKRNIEPSSVLVFAPFAFLSNQLEVTRSLPYTAGLEALNFTQDEAEAINKLKNAKIYKAFNATETALRQQKADYGILHLATHALVDDENPMSSRLVFAKDSINDGYLYNYELPGLDLKTNLVCLSACETGLGTYQKGEGVLSLARGFQLAGTPNVMMTLWKIPDASSSALMTSFYENLEDTKYTQALYEAKFKLLESNDAAYAHPYYWSAFILVGEPAENISYLIVYYVMGGILMLGLLIFVLLKLRKARMN